MKILHIINHLNTGGAEKLLSDILLPLKEKCGSVDLLLLDGSNTYLKDKIEKMGIAIFSLGIGSVYNPFLIFKMKKYLCNYDLIHVHLFPAQYYVAIAKIIFRLSLKMITTEHNTDNRRRKIPFSKYIERIIYRQYDKIICISSQTEIQLKKHVDSIDNKTIVINNGICIEKYSKAKEYLKINLLEDYKLGDFLLLQVARFTEQKDQSTLIRAMQYLPNNVKTIFVGDGNLRGQAELLAFSLGVKNRTFFLGFRTDVAEILKTVDLLIMSSNWEGFGLAVVEGMAASKPVIASNVPGLAEVVGDAGFLFEKGNEHDLAAKIYDLMKSEDLYKQMVQKGIKRASTFDVKNMIAGYYQVYIDVLN